MKDMTLENAMNDTMKRNTKAKAAKRTRLRAAVLAAALLMGTNNAYAGMPVIDFSQILGQIRGWISDTTQYAKEVTHFDQMKEQIDNIRDIFNMFNFAIGLPDGEALTKVDDRYLVEETCGDDAAGLSMTTVMSVLGMDITSDLKKQQQQICVNIQMMQNRKYNDSVEFLDKTIKQAQAESLKIMDAGKGNSVGATSAATREAARLNNELNLLAQNWGTRMQSYDAYIATMEKRQNLLAKTALKGKKRLARDLIQTAVLKGALSID